MPLWEQSPTAGIALFNALTTENGTRFNSFQPPTSRNLIDKAKARGSTRWVLGRPSTSGAKANGDSPALVPVGAYWQNRGTTWLDDCLAHGEYAAPVSHWTGPHPVLDGFSQAPGVLAYCTCGYGRLQRMNRHAPRSLVRGAGVRFPGSAMPFTIYPAMLFRGVLFSEDSPPPTNTGRRESRTSTSPNQIGKALHHRIHRSEAVFRGHRASFAVVLGCGQECKCGRRGPGAAGPLLQVFVSMPGSKPRRLPTDVRTSRADRH